MTPVGDHIIPPNPMTGINTLSGIIGIQQQRQALQTGQYQQQAAQAGAQQEQQKNQELQAAQALSVEGARSGKYTKEDGTFDRQRMADDLTKIGPYALPAAGQLLSQANEIVANSQAHQALTLSRKKEIGDTFASLAADPELDNTKFIDSIETLRQQHPDDKEFSRMLTSMSTHMPGQADTNTLRGLAGRWSAAATGEPQTVPGQVDTGGQVQPTGVNRFTGAITPAGAPIPKTLAPGQQPSYLAAAATAQGAAGGQVTSDNEVFKQVTQAGANAQRGIELTQKIEQEAAQVRTGKYTGEFANRLTVLQQHDPSITARQLLQKDTENLKSLAEQTGTTVQEREQIGSGFPTPDVMNPDAMAKASRYWQGFFNMTKARSANAVEHVGQNGTAGLTLKDQAFMKDASPGKYAPPEPKNVMPTGAKLTNYAKAKFGGDTAKATAFLKQHGYE